VSPLTLSPTPTNAAANPFANEHAAPAAKPPGTGHGGNPFASGGD